MVGSSWVKGTRSLVLPNHRHIFSPPHMTSNPNPSVYSPTIPRRSYAVSLSDADTGRDGVDAIEVFELLRHINDPEHPLTLEQLDVAKLDFIAVDDGASTLDVRFKPTIPHCSMATLIGLCIRVKLIRARPARFKTTVRIEPGTHMQEESVNKQLNDKERVSAALENANLLELVNRCLAGTDQI